MMRRTRFFPLLIALAIGPAACAEQETAETGTAEEQMAVPMVDQATLEQANAEMLEPLNRGDVAGFVDRAYTEDAMIYPPGAAAMQGREAIQQYWQGGYDQMGISDVQLTTNEVEVYDNAAYEQGSFSFQTNSGPATGSYVVIWKQGPDGEWRWHRDIWNMDATPGQG